mmetsp:Transcript_1128/g.2519  ORF Transcript_1128/g.2519 Transcript_1128/m.2519 type:complete len:220 (+) Transcript_1128:901-1560(+)
MTWSCSRCSIGSRWVARGRGTIGWGGCAKRGGGIARRGGTMRWWCTIGSRRIARRGCTRGWGTKRSRGIAWRRGSRRRGTVRGRGIARRRGSERSRGVARWRVCSRGGTCARARWGVCWRGDTCVRARWGVCWRWGTWARGRRMAGLAYQLGIPRVAVRVQSRGRARVGGRGLAGLYMRGVVAASWGPGACSLRDLEQAQYHLAVLRVFDSILLLHVVP